MDYSKLSIAEYVNGVNQKKFTAVEAVKAFVDKCKKDTRNAVLEVFSDWKTLAAAVDKKVANGQPTGSLAGVPIIIKDNILYEGHISSAGSKMLEKFVSPYSATIVEKLLAADAVIIARANMDEFSMGGTCENSAYGPCKNALSDKNVSGGSSGGCAVAVALGMCLGAIGTDTGGSVRQPASFNGVVGVKPTYGTVSRFGLIAYASSLDQAGPIAKTVDDVQLLLDVIAGKDINDATSVDMPAVKKELFDVKKLRVGRIKEVWSAAKNIEMIERYNAIFADLEKRGAKIVDVSIPNFDKILAAYYIIAPAEACTNLSRFDGVKYTSAVPDAANLDQLYKQTRTKYFGSEVKRRIMLGSFVLSSSFSDAYYTKAVRLQKFLRARMSEVFKTVDCVLLPTAFGPATELGKPVTDPVQAYLEDLFTVPANILGIPAISVPCGAAKNGLPIGLQIMTDKFNEKLLFSISKDIGKHFVDSLR